MRFYRSIKYFVFTALIFVFIGCAPQMRYGMIKDPSTGIQYGSVVERSFFIDSSQFENNQIKISARNVSGNFNYNISELISRLQTSFAKKGYSSGGPNEFGIKFDVVVEYSGHIQENMAAKYGFLGALAGGITGYRSKARAGEAIGVLGGLTLGAISGSYVADNTYIIIANVTVGIIDRLKNSKKTVTFSSSPDLQDDSDVLGVNYFRDVKSTKIAVYAGGRNVKHLEVVNGVKNRLYSIISDII